jgi:hypothetical protein
MMLGRIFYGAFDDLPLDQKLLACHNRAIEWLAFPMLLGQTLLPVLYAFLPWQWLIAAFVVSLVIWPFVRLPLASFKAVSFGDIVGKPKWFVAFGMAVYFYLHEQVGLAVLSVLTPVSMGVLLMFYISRKHLLVNQIENIFMNQMGCPTTDSPDS